jgi:sugar lactone lactonase YvrE
MRRIASGFNLPECPRWHRGELWWIDMYGHSIWRWNPVSKAVRVVDTGEDDPGGLGFMPDGSLLYVLMRSRRVMRLQDGRTSEHAELSGYHATYLNDMVVDASGRAYVDATTRRDLGDSGPDRILIVEPDGRVRVGTEAIERSNGLAITPDGKTLIASQPPLHQLSAATITESGDLVDERLWNAAPLPAGPDGICLDEDGAVWFAGLDSHSAIRMLPDGRITDEISMGRRVFACMLGGSGRRELFILSAEASTPQIRAREFPGLGYVDSVAVDVPGAGLP